MNQQFHPAQSLFLATEDHETWTHQVSGALENKTKKCYKIFSSIRIFYRIV